MSSEDEFNGKEAILSRFKTEGYDPSDFTFYYAKDHSSQGEIECCRFEDLPEKLDSFCCRSKDGWLLFNYDRYKDPSVVRLEKPL